MSDHPCVKTGYSGANRVPFYCPSPDQDGGRLSEAAADELHRLWGYVDMLPVDAEGQPVVGFTFITLDLPNCHYDDDDKNLWGTVRDETGGEYRMRTGDSYKSRAAALAARGGER